MTTASKTDPMSLQAEKWEVSRLVPYERNAKLHHPEQVERLAATIGRFGWDQPIVVDQDGVIIKGHGRRLAAIHLGLTHVPVLVRRDLTKAEADAVRISDNAVFSLSFDTRAMQEEINRLMNDETFDFVAIELGLSAKDQDLLTKQIDLAADDILITDTRAEVEAQKAEDDRRVSASDKEDVSLADAFGFKRISREQARMVMRFMGHVEEATGKLGGEAFLGWLDQQAAGGVL